MPTYAQRPPLPRCRTCGQVPQHHHLNDRHCYTNGIWLFGCACDGEDDMGSGPTPACAEARWANAHACPTVLSIRRNVRALSIVLAGTAVLSLASLLLHPEPLFGEERTHWRLLAILIAFGIGVVAECIHWLVESPAAVAAERQDPHVANLPRATFRL